MIYSLRGTLLQKNLTWIVLEVQGVSYKIHVSMQTHVILGSIGDQEMLYTLYAFHSNANLSTEVHQLFGFKTEAERDLFEKLITVSGVGLNTARLILSAFSVTDLVHAIETENAKMISSVKGIGEKTAQRIILDLKGKLKNFYNLVSEKNPQNHAISEARLALQTLGFNDKSIDQALKQMDDKITDTQDLLVKILKVIR